MKPARYGKTNLTRRITAWRGSLSNWVRASFSRRHGRFVATTAFVQLLPILSAPIIMRLYTPEEFGLFAVFSAFATILSAVGTLALHNAILVEQEDEAAMQAGFLALLVNVGMSAVILLVLAVTPEWLLQSAFGLETIGLLPWSALTVLLSGTLITIYTWFIRTGSYPLLTRSKLVQGLSTVAVQIGIGWAQFGAVGLIFANIFGFALAVLLLAPTFARTASAHYKRLSARSLWASFSHHRALAIYTVPAQLINSIGSQLPQLLINRFFGAYLLGQYSLANRVISQPLSFAAISAQDIFREKCSSEFRTNGNCKVSFKTFFVGLTILSIAMLIPLTLVAPPLFKFVFGSSWTDAGIFVQALAVLIGVRFISSPLSYVWILRGKQMLDMLWQIGLLLLTIGAFIGTSTFWPEASLTDTLLVYSGVVGFWYGICIILSHRFAR
jgi:O-antigen/teichoic acid export membrane protein